MRWSGSRSEERIAGAVGSDFDIGKGNRRVSKIACPVIRIGEGPRIQHNLIRISTAAARKDWHVGKKAHTVKHSEQKDNPAAGKSPGF